MEPNTFKKGGFLVLASLCAVMVTLSEGFARAATEGMAVKKRIAVMRFESTDKFGGGDVGEGLSAMLSNELTKTEKFMVVERAALSDILGEQQLGNKGLATVESAAGSGKLMGAQILIRGTVSDFEAAKQGGGAQLSIGGGNLPIGGLLGKGGSTAHVAIDLRLIDATTGEVIDSYRAEAEAKASSTHFALQHVKTGVGFGTEQFNKTPLGKAALEAIREAVAHIVRRTESIPWTGRISEVTETGKVYVNAGEDVGLKPGDQLEIFVVTKEVKDPDTGETLGVEEHRLGALKIESARPRFSIGTLQEGPVPKAGDIVRIRTSA